MLEDPAVLAAALTAAAALLLGAVTAVTGRRADRRLKFLEHDLKRNDQRDVELRAALQELERQRGPLHDAAEDLRSRLQNIRQDNFLETYLKDDDARRQQLALRSTAYRFAKYWAVVELMYNEVVLLRFRDAGHTREVANCLTTIGKTMASDRRRFGGRNLMVWREEQRAVAELMQVQDRSGPATLGFHTFSRYYDEQFEPWFRAFMLDLSVPSASSSPRLEELQARLEQLVDLLQRDRSFSLADD